MTVIDINAARARREERERRKLERKHNPTLADDMLDITKVCAVMALGVFVFYAALVGPRELQAMLYQLTEEWK